MRLTIGRKLNSLILLLQIMSIGGAVTLATELFTSDLTGLLRKGTLDTASMLSGRVRAEMKTAADRARTLGAASLEDFRYPEDRIRFIQDNLAVDSKFIGLSLFRINQNKVLAQWRIVNPSYNKSLKQKDFLTIEKNFPLNISVIRNGNVDFTVGYIPDGTPVIRMGLPFVKRKDGTFSQFLVLEIQQEKISALFAESTNFVSYLVDKNGQVLGSTDPTKIQIGKSIKRYAIVKASLSDPNRPSGQMDFKDDQNEIQMAAYQSVGFSGLKVFSQVPLSRATLAQKTLYRRTGLLAGFFLCVALFLGFLFSQGITKSIRALANAAEKIKDGDFSVRLEHKKNSADGDEIQKFSWTFNEMVSGLEEREKIKSTFAKFHSKEVADKILSGELQLGGERKEATVFFSDVRGFTAMSENMDPETLVSVLNRYMTRMVRVIIRNGGIVDKYVGDAIMAVWGVPIAKERDAINAINAALEMREELAELNLEFIEEGFPELKIGMGLNYGALISGNIGSDERMEFTVIGDSVNTASRIESLTKSIGTDLLISQSMVDQLKGKFIVEKTHEAHVKGKSEPLIIYKVHGYIDENGNEIRVETAYSSYKIEKSDKVSKSPLADPSIEIKTPSDIQAAIQPATLKELKPETIDRDQHPRFEDANKQEPTFDPIPSKKKLNLPPAPPLEAITHARIHLAKLEKQKEKTLTGLIIPSHRKKSAQKPAQLTEKQKPAISIDTPVIEGKKDLKNSLLPKLEEIDLSLSSDSEISAGEIILESIDLKEKEPPPPKDDEFDLLEGANNLSIDLTRSEIIYPLNNKMGGLLDGTQTGIVQKLEELPGENLKKISTKKSA